MTPRAGLHDTTPRSQQYDSNDNSEDPSVCVGGGRRVSCTLPGSQLNNKNVKQIALDNTMRSMSF